MRPSLPALLAFSLLTGSRAFAQSPRHPDRVKDCGLLDPELVLQAPPVPEKERALVEPPGRPAIRPVRPGPPPPHAGGALSGKTVYVSAGHGWTWTGSAWRTQRPTTNAIVEDLVSAETVAQYLLPYLRNMGAYVVPVRDPDFQTELVVVDDADAIVEGSLDEQSTGDAGWGEVALPITSNATNPFEAGGTRLFGTSASAKGSLVYRATIPASGYYNVYVSYVQGPDRAPDAHYVVAHAGGQSQFRVDQRRHGTTWVLLGKYWFEEGAPPEQASVSLFDDSEEAAAGAVISADAVRFGAGVGRIDRGGGANDRPMWENNCRYNAQLSGAPPSVFDAIDTDFNDDVASRSRFADWDHEPGEDAVYVAWHSNAPNPGRGTESYSYSPNPPPAPLSAFTGVAGSVELQTAVHDRLIGDLRAHWDPEWPDRGKFTAYFGEVNPYNNDEMPSILLEVAFHDTPADADALREPLYRYVAARAIARGIAGYFSDRDGTPLVLPPEPPVAVRVENDGKAGLRVSWKPPAEGSAPVDGYRVYVGSNGYAFDDGVAVDGETLPLEDLGAGAARYVRVAAVNAGGESLASEVVGARVAASGAAPVLLVAGFDRLDAALMPVEDFSAFAMAAAQRMILDRMNDGSYAARHGAAIAGAGYSFDGAADDAIDEGLVDLAKYAAVDWFVGEASSGNQPLTAAQRTDLTSYLEGGGRLLVSGAELGWALDLNGDASEKSFYTGVLRTTYAEDDSETYEIEAPADGPYADLGPVSFDEQGPGSYDADFPDTLAAQRNGAAVLKYAGGIGGVAAIAWKEADDGAAVVNFGFPFETIVGADSRTDVMQRTLAYFGVEEEPVLPGDDDPGKPRGDGDPSGGSHPLGDASEDTDGSSCACRAGRGDGGRASTGVALALVALALASRASSWSSGRRRTSGR